MGSLDTPRLKCLMQNARGPPKERELNMLYYALVFLVFAIVAGVLGFGGIAGTAAGIAQILFFVFLVGLIFTLVGNITRRKRTS